MFPSIKNVEAGRFVRHSVLNSDIEFKNFDYLMAIRYLTIVGGRALLHRVGVGRLEPRWLADRQDLTSGGGTKSRNPLSWADTKKEIMEFEKKRIIGAVLEILVNLVMCTRVLWSVFSTEVGWANWVKEYGHNCRTYHEVVGQCMGEIT